MDIYGIIPAITGKVELVYEGELEGIANVAYMLIGKAIRAEYVMHFPDPERSKKAKAKNPYTELLNWFGEGKELDMLNSASEQTYVQSLEALPGLQTLIKDFKPGTSKEETLLLKEFILHGMAEFSQLSKRKLESSLRFSDLVGSIFNMKEEDEDTEN